MRFRRVRCFVFFLVAASCLLALAQPAEAIPAWARKYSLTCFDCHSAYPTLNSFGRDFKVNGYRLREEVEGDDDFVDAIADFLKLDKGFPISARGVMRPLDKKKDGDLKIRAFHEIEIFFAGRVYNNVSTFVEIEGEDEDGFNIFVDAGTMTWSPLPQANFSLGWAPVFWNDPFASLADGGRRMTRGHKGPLDQRFAARERLRSASQWIGGFGRVANDRVFYMGGVSAGGDDPEGGDSKDGYGRIMVEAASGVNVGGFILAGSRETQGADQSFYRSGIDFQIEKGGLTAYGLVMFTEDDLLGPTAGTIAGTESTTSGYVEAFYVAPVGKIHVVPLVRLDFLSDINHTTDLTLNLGFYLLQNLKTYFEWWQNIESPSGSENKWRATWQIDFAF